MRSMKVITAACFVSVVSAFGAGCAPTSEDDDAERFREALPVQDELALRVPGGTSGATKTAGLRIASGGGTNATARYYQFTRDMTSAVDYGTAVILGGIWGVVHSPPTTLEPKKAVWGPGSGNALEPAIWKLTVTEVGTAEYDYVLEGQSKSGGAWLTVVKGHGYGKAHADHKKGWFEWDNDAYKTLEPTRGKDEGTTKVTYALAQLPASISVELRPHPTDLAKGWADVKVVHAQGGAGSVDITTLSDVNDAKNTKLEDVRLVSQWTSNGSGRADISMKNGDLPFTVDAAECWSSAFARVYYKDTVDFEAPTGDASVCALPAQSL